MKLVVIFRNVVKKDYGRNFVKKDYGGKIKYYFKTKNRSIRKSMK